jgi:hypothetical protein
VASDGPTPPNCDKDIYLNGTVVLITHTIPSNAMERWVQAVNRISGQSVDWYYLQGKAIVKTTGNVSMVKEAIEYLKPVHDALYVEAFNKINEKEPYRFNPEFDSIPWFIPPEI